ncbi:hypothetical protein [Pseudodesulfovibrio sediminis]|uniref:ABC transporter permease n=1 Tax=Pseudodesulfovibrio sediminis TaxID=2810563 RepID=A0ABM7P5H1_9BACT|nr:hypothetical protein [Pseudodesulfovibrio sediminis]BCS88133.1 hypothetical protein PSDVSF_13750 [Pseudodesulfovibrio sediminis]
MYTALAYKEWLKLRRVFWVPLIVVLGALASIFISFRHVNEIIGPTMLWIDVAVADKIFYNDLRYVPVFAAMWFALFQFIPECSGKRLRLLFHLPVPRRRALYFMVGIGLACTGVVCVIGAIGLALIVGHYMPFQAVRCVVFTCAPWFMAGFPAYLGTVLVIMDPAWPHKFMHGFVSILFVQELISSASQGAFEYSLIYYALACLLWILPIEVSAYRFKQGVSW